MKLLATLAVVTVFAKAKTLDQCITGFTEDSSRFCYAKEIDNLVNLEQETSLFYPALSYKFASQSLNRPHFAKMLANEADESLESAHGLAEFQQSRGANVKLEDVKSADIENIDTIKAALQEVTIKEKNIANELNTLYKLSKDIHLMNKPGCWMGCSKQLDPLITATDDSNGKAITAPHLSDLMKSTYIPKQLKEIHEIKTHQQRLTQFGNDEIMFDRLLFEL